MYNPLILYHMNKKPMKRSNLTLMIIFFVIIIVFIPFLLFERVDNTLISSFIEYFGVIGALGGIVAIYYQMRREKNIAEGEFIYSLYDGFSNNEKIKDIYQKLEECKNQGCKKDPFVKDDIGNIIDYLTFFETMYLLIKRKIIKIDLIDELFAYRFFIAVHNPYVQKKNLIKYNTYYKNTYRLHKMWVSHRLENNEKIPFSEYNLKNKDNNYDRMI